MHSGIVLVPMRVLVVVFVSVVVFVVGGEVLPGGVGRVDLDVGLAHEARRCRRGGAA
jgi:hypothetical protein